VTTGVSRLASVWRGLCGVSLRIARFASCWRVLDVLGPRLGVKESRRRSAPHRPGRGLLAGYSPWGPRLLLKELDGVSCCPWEVSPPLMAEAWSPVQIHLAGSPPVGGGLPVGCLASSDGGGLVPGADPSRGGEISTWTSTVVFSSYMKICTYI
jgi:hypothetical protein